MFQIAKTEQCNIVINSKAGKVPTIQQLSLLKLGFNICQLSLLRLGINICQLSLLRLGINICQLSLLRLGINICQLSLLRLGINICCQNVRKLCGHKVSSRFPRSAHSPPHPNTHKHEHWCQWEWFIQVLITCFVTVLLFKFSLTRQTDCSMIDNG